MDLPPDEYASVGLALGFGGGVQRVFEGLVREATAVAAVAGCDGEEAEET
ncbi:hypothetical protein ACQPXT_13600 [Streptomyces sp. CA-100214]